MKNKEIANRIIKKLSKDRYKLSIADNISKKSLNSIIGETELLYSKAREECLNAFRCAFSLYGDNVPDEVKRQFDFLFNEAYTRGLENVKKLSGNGSPDNKSLTRIAPNNTITYVWFFHEPIDKVKHPLESDWYMFEC